MVHQETPFEVLIKRLLTSEGREIAIVSAVEERLISPFAKDGKGKEIINEKFLTAIQYYEKYHMHLLAGKLCEELPDGHERAIQNYLKADKPDRAAAILRARGKMKEAEKVMEDARDLHLKWRPSKKNEGKRIDVEGLDTLTSALLEKNEIDNAIALNLEHGSFRTVAGLYEKKGDLRNAITFREQTGEYYLCARHSLELKDEDAAVHYFLKEKWWKNAEDILENKGPLAVIKMYEEHKIYFQAANYGWIKCNETLTLPFLETLLLWGNTLLNAERAGEYNICKELCTTLGDETQTKVYEDLEKLLGVSKLYKQESKL